MPGHDMNQDPMLRPEPLKTRPESTSSWNRQPATDGSSAFSLDPDNYDDLAEVAKTLSAMGRGDVALDLALDLVLNEVVEQARLATGANGAAVALSRDGEMVCRATTGDSAPGLGVRVEAASGLSGECLRTGEVQHCSDTETDPRVDAEACRQLGIRSAMLMPLLDGAGPFGILEVFSSRENAFGDRDINTLHALALRIVASRKAAEKGGSLPNLFEETKPPQVPELSPPQPEEVSTLEAAPPVDPFIPESSQHEAAGRQAAFHESAFHESPPPEVVIEEQPVRGYDLWTTVLVVLVVAAAVTLGVLLGWRGALLGSRPDGHSATKSVVVPAASAAAEDAAREPIKASAPPNVREYAADEPAERVPARSMAQPKTSNAGDPAASANGGLTVTQNGKVIYRLASPPVRNPAGSRGASEEPATRLIHRVQPEYPAEATQKRIQGAVVLNVQVLGNGSVGNIEVASGDPLLAEAAVHAVRQWKYQPYVVDGQPVQSQTRITIRFSLPNS